MGLKVIAALTAVVLMLALGQVLFKASAASWVQTGELLSLRVAVRLVPALVIYAVATLAWVWVLQHVALSWAYPFVALTYLIVPALSWWLFGERVGWTYFVGVMLICAGVAITAFEHDAGSGSSSMAAGRDHREAGPTPPH